MEPFAGLLHRRHGRTDDAEHALEVDIERVVPLLVGELVQRNAMGDAGIRDDTVERAETAFDVGHDTVGVDTRAHIEGMELSLSARGHDGFGHGPALVQHVCYDDAITGFAEAQCGRTADADPTAGDQNRSHGVPHSMTSPELGPSVWPT